MAWDTIYSLSVLIVMLVLYGLEQFHRRFSLALAVACASSALGFFYLPGQWPFGVISLSWALVALRRWWLESANDRQAIALRYRPYFQFEPITEELFARDLPPIEMPNGFEAAKRAIRERYSLFRSANSWIPDEITPDPRWNIVGLGLGRKWIDRKPSARAALLLFVRRKFFPEEIKQSHQLPSEVFGIPTQVIETGSFQLFAPRTANPRERWHPHAPGCSIGPAKLPRKIPIVGTFGAVVRGRGNPQRISLLSAAHVLTDCEVAYRAGSPIFQPGLLDCFDSSNPQPIGQLGTCKLWAQQNGVTLDAAIADLSNPAGATNHIPLIGHVGKVGTLTVETPVEKFGRTTAHTRGIVLATDVDIDIPVQSGTIHFLGQTLVQGMLSTFAYPGDSGALVVASEMKSAVGLLVGGSELYSGHFTVVTPIQPILDALNVDLVDSRP
jgi:hypothetical protein